MTHNTTDTEAQEMALYTPTDVIIGWMNGYRANADTENAQICEMALLLQEEWKEEPRSMPGNATT